MRESTAAPPPEQPVHPAIGVVTSAVVSLQCLARSCRPSGEVYAVHPDIARVLRKEAVALLARLDGFLESSNLIEVVASLDSALAKLDDKSGKGAA